MKKFHWSSSDNIKETIWKTRRNVRTIIGKLYSNIKYHWMNYSKHVQLFSNGISNSSNFSNWSFTRATTSSEKVATLSSRDITSLTGVMWQFDCSHQAEQPSKIKWHIIKVDTMMAFECTYSILSFRISCWGRVGDFSGHSYRSDRGDDELKDEFQELSSKWTKQKKILTFISMW